MCLKFMMIQLVCVTLLVSLAAISFTLMSLRNWILRNELLENGNLAEIVRSFYHINKYMHRTFTFIHVQLKKTSHQ